MICDNLTFHNNLIGRQSFNLFTGYEEIGTGSQGTTRPGVRAGECWSLCLNPGVANSKSEFLSTTQNAFIDNF